MINLTIQEKKINHFYPLASTALNHVSLILNESKLYAVKWTGRAVHYYKQAPELFLSHPHAVIAGIALVNALFISVIYSAINIKKRLSGQDGNAEGKINRIVILTELVTAGAFFGFNLLLSKAFKLDLRMTTIAAVACTLLSLRLLYIRNLYNRSQNENLTQKNVDEEKEKESILQQLNQFNQQLEQALIAMSCLEVQIKELQSKEEKMAEDKHCLEKDKSDLTVALQQAKDEQKLANQELQSLEKQKEGIEQINLDLITKLKAYTSRLKMIRAAKQRLTGRIGDLRHQNARLQKNVDIRTQLAEEAKDYAEEQEVLAKKRLRTALVELQKREELIAMWNERAFPINMEEGLFKIENEMKDLKNQVRLRDLHICMLEAKLKQRDEGQKEKENSSASSSPKALISSLSSTPKTPKLGLTPTIAQRSLRPLSNQTNRTAGSPKNRTPLEENDHSTSNTPKGFIITLLSHTSTPTASESTLTPMTAQRSPVTQSNQTDRAARSPKNRTPLAVNQDDEKENSPSNSSGQSLISFLSQFLTPTTTKGTPKKSSETSPKTSKPQSNQADEMQMERRSPLATRFAHSPYIESPLKFSATPRQLLNEASAQQRPVNRSPLKAILSPRYLPIKYENFTPAKVYKVN